MFLLLKLSKHRDFRARKILKRNEFPFPNKFSAEETASGWGSFGIFIVGKVFPDCNQPQCNALERLCVCLFVAFVRVFVLVFACMCVCVFTCFCVLVLCVFTGLCVFFQVVIQLRLRQCLCVYVLSFVCLCVFLGSFFH